MDDPAFETLAGAALERLANRIEDAAGDELDVDLDDGVLTVETGSGAQFLINRHAPSGELWLSSPVSGAGHFARNAETGGWTDKRRGGDLAERLEAELSQALGRPVSLSGPE